VVILASIGRKGGDLWKLETVEGILRYEMCFHRKMEFGHTPPENVIRNRFAGANCNFGRVMYHFEKKIILKLVQLSFRMENAITHCDS